jgi:hypothetical protein
MDLIVKPGATELLASATVIAGWVEVHGTLRCDGDLACLGISIEPGGSLRCRELVANVVEVDNIGGRTTLSAKLVRARFVSLVQIIEPPPLDAEYVHHYGGDLNPSFDYERGDLDILRGVEGDVPRQFDLGELRRELCAGRNPFAKGELVVEIEPGEPLQVAEVPPELASWLASHPGPQRQLLADLMAQWTGKLAGGGGAIRKAVSSPKLAAERDAWLAEQGLAHHAPPKQPSQPKVTVRPATPRDPSSWLDELPLDATQLDRVNEEITEIPPRIARYAQLVDVQLAYNQLARLPDELFALPLTKLDVRGNRIAELPTAIGRCATLQSLSVESNPIARLPDELCALASLAHLDLSFTAITALPDEFGRLASLQFLKLQDCRLTDLPESFFSLPALDSLYLHGTRLRSSVIARIRATFPRCEMWNFR